MNGVSLNIDVGTVTTVAVCRLPGGATIPLTIDGQPYLPSGVYLELDGTIVTGTAASAHHAAGGRYIPSPIAELGAAAADMARDRAVEAVAAVLRRLAVEATAVTGLPVTGLRIATPAWWGPRRCTRLRLAAHAAGLPAPELPPAPVAVAGYAAQILGMPLPVGAFLLVCDIGAAGTTATVVQRRTDIDWDPRSTDTDPAAGLDALDDAITAHFTNPDGPDTSAVVIAQAAPGFDTRQTARVAVRRARQALADVDRTIVTLPDGVDRVLTRDLLATLTAPVTARAVDLALKRIDGADIDPPDLAGVVIVGGGAYLPDIAATIGAGLGVTATVAARPDQAVTLGTAHTNTRTGTGTAMWAATPPPDLGLRPLATAVVAGIASLGLMIHAMRSAYVSTNVDGGVDYVLFNSGEFAAGAALAMVAVLGFARAFALVDIARTTGAPTRTPLPGQIFLGATGVGLTGIAIYGLLDGIVLHQPAGAYLTTGLQAALPLAVIAGVIAAISPRLAYLGGTAYNRLRHPITGIILATAGITAVQYAYNTPLPAGTVDLVSRVGGALVGAACAWTLTRRRLPRAIAVPLLAAVGALAATVSLSGAYGAAYVACLWIWWTQATIRLAGDAFPDVRDRARRWRPRIAAEPQPTAIAALYPAHTPDTATGPVTAPVTALED